MRKFEGDAPLLCLNHLDALSGLSYPRQAFFLGYLCTHTQFLGMPDPERRQDDDSPSVVHLDIGLALAACRELMNSPFWKKTGLPSANQILTALRQARLPSEE